MSSPELAAAQPFVLLFLALLIDAVVGDMRWFFRLVPHPIVLVGRLIGFLDDKLNRSKRGKAALLIRGCIVTVLVTGLAAALALGFVARRYLADTRRARAPLRSTARIQSPPRISPQLTHSPHGVGVGPFSQLSALARARAAVVLPTPRAPVNKKAW